MARRGNIWKDSALILVTCIGLTWILPVIAIPVLIILGPRDESALAWAAWVTLGAIGFKCLVWLVGLGLFFFKLGKSK